MQHSRPRDGRLDHLRWDSRKESEPKVEQPNEKRPPEGGLLRND
jgi:hypothetical protein